MRIFNLRKIKGILKEKRIQVLRKNKDDEYCLKKKWLINALVSKKITKSSLKLADEVFEAYYENLNKRYKQKEEKLELIKKNLIYNQKFKHHE